MTGRRILHSGGRLATLSLRTMHSFSEYTLLFPAALYQSAQESRPGWQTRLTGGEDIYIRATKPIHLNILSSSGVTLCNDSSMPT